MTCSGQQFLNCKLAKNCKCYRAVMRTYKAMCADKTIPEDFARDAAQRVYRFHRPSEEHHAAQATLERWLSDGHIQ